MVHRIGKDLSKGPNIRKSIFEENYDKNGLVCIIQFLISVRFEIKMASIFSKKKATEIYYDVGCSAIP